MTRGEYMRRARRNAELTIKQLAALSGVSANAIGGLERGKRISGQYMTIEVLADALGLSIDEYTGHRRRASNVTQKD
jgi:transcriptional regulator with XRE-family HTH domain|nr:MAG TPA: helix-turn-helix domain protein [Caudoviricetes sp.]